MFEECGRKALTDQKEKQMSDIRSKDMDQHNRVCAQIDLDAIAYNMEQMKDQIGKEARLIAVIKTDGYGHGAVPIARMFETFSYVWGYAVACIEEAVSLRKEGIKKPILVLGCVFPDQYETMIKNEIRAAVYTKEMAEGMSDEAVRQGKNAYFHIKIDTGMGRIGFPVNSESVNLIEEISKLPNIHMEGLFTHFAKADEKEKSYTLKQHERFLWMKEQLEKRNVDITYYDCDNSAGIIDFPNLKHDLARAGISTYGMYPSDEVEKNRVPLRPAMSLNSYVTYVKTIEAGTEVSYGGIFKAEKPMRVATVCIGYADGYPRSASNKGRVLIHGKSARILGRVCMDQLMVDVTDIPEVQPWDLVTLVGRDGDDCITMEELAEASGGFHYELACIFGKRVPRVYVKGGKIVGTKDYFHDQYEDFLE